jgi:hypothetical protein
MGFVNIRLEDKSGKRNTARVITELGIGNFKAFGEMQRVPIKPLTLIFGANSSGKSSIIHGLLLAHHGLEKGTLDAHQTVLGGESVDLGGFRHYAHQHEVERRVFLQIERTAPEASTKDVPAPEDRWIAAIGAPRRIGVTFHVGLRAGATGVAERAVEPAILRLEVVINGRSFLELDREEASTFRVKAVDLDHPFLDSIVCELVTYLREGALRVVQYLDDSKPRRELSAEERQRIERENQKRVDSDPFLSCLAPAKTDEQAARAALSRFKQSFAAVLKERRYRLDGLDLKDIGPDDRWDYSGWEADVESEGAIHFFGQHEPEPEAPDRWAEAQAIRYYLNILLSSRLKKLRDELRNLSYLGPLRCVPSRHVTSIRDQDPNWHASGAAAWEHARHDPKVVEALNECLGPDRLGTNYRVIAKRMVETEELLQALKEHPGAYGRPPHLAAEEALRNQPEVATLTELLFEDTKSRTLVSHRDIGFGVSQVLPVLVAALASRERLIAVEQPELHLHPALQSQLGDVFIESALGGRKNTFLLETHSEHLILRILRRVRETTEDKLPAGTTPVRPEDVSVVFVEPTAKGAVVRHLPVTPDGDFGAPWPGGFFAERLADLP